MGSKWFTGGVIAAPRGRIQFDFILDGIRYRPSIKRPPPEADLRRARERLEVIKHRGCSQVVALEAGFTVSKVFIEDVIIWPGRSSRRHTLRSNICPRPEAFTRGRLHSATRYSP